MLLLSCLLALQSAGSEQPLAVVAPLTPISFSFVQKQLTSKLKDVCSVCVYSLRAACQLDMQPLVLDFLHQGYLLSDLLAQQTIA